MNHLPRIIGCCIVVAVLVAAAEYAALRSAATIPVTQEIHRIREARRIAEGPENFDVLFTGDSTVVTGINPVIFSQRTKLSGYNVGTFADVAASGDAFFAETYAAHHAAPKTLFVVRNYLTFEKPYNEHAWYQHFANVHVAWRAFLTGGFSTDMLAKTILARALPSFRYRLEIKRWLDGRLFPPKRDRNSYDIIPAVDTAGFIGQTSTMKVEQVMEPEPIDAAIAIEHIAGTNIDVLKSICRTGEKYNFDVVVVLMPFYSLSTNDQTNNVYRDVIADMLQGEPRCKVITLDVPFELKDMNDPIHANSTGATLFTNALADAYLGMAP